MPAHLRQHGVSYLIAVLVTVVTAAIRFLCDDFLHQTATFIPFVVPVMVAGWYGGLKPGLVATFLSAALSAYLFIGPHYSLRIENWSEAIAVSIFVIVGVTISLLCEAMHSGRRGLELERTKLSKSLAGERRLAAQHAVTRVLAEAPTLDDAIPQVLQAAADCLGWEVGALWLVDEDGKLLRCAGFWSHASVRIREFEAVTKNRTFEPGVGLPGRVWSTAAPAWIPDVVRDSNFPRAETADREGLHGAFGFPIVLEGQVLGVVEFFSREIQQPDEDILRMMNSTGGQLGQFISRKRAEQALHEREQRFARFTQHLPGLAWIKDLEGRYVYANDAAAKAFRMPLPELYGKTDDELFPPATAAQFKANDRQALEGSAGVQVIETLEHEDGTLHSSIVSKFAVPGPDGHTAFVGGMAIDITDQKRAEQALAASEARKTAVLNTALDAIITIDREGHVIEFNPAAERMFGYRRDEALGRSMAELIIPAALRERHRRGIEHYLATGEGPVLNRRLELSAMRSDGQEFPVEVAITRLSHDGPPLFTGYIRDITEQKRTEQALKEADRRKDEFLATMAHELRNPLAPIRSAVQILKAKGPADADLAYGRDVIDRQVQQMVRLLDDLLDVSRISRNKLELHKQQVELVSVVDSAVETSRPLIDAGHHELSISLPAEPVYLAADPVRLAQVLANLLNNAAKYTESGGKIALAAERQGSDVLVCVRDNGIGIAADMLPRLFEMFSQATSALSRSQGGLGIGLSLVKGLVELHGGAVAANSAGPGKGSEFVVRLPIMVQMPVAAPHLPAGVEEPAAEPKWRVLIVDDNRDGADSLATMLRLRGHETHTAYDGAQAVEMAASVRPDVVLLDIGMPKMNGCEAARRIREQPWGRSMLLIALTGWGREEDRRRTDEAGFNYHLVKPVDTRKLLELLAAPQVSTA